MINIQNLLLGVLFGLLAQIFTFFQLQGQLKFTILKDNFWICILMGIPISMMFLFSVKNLVIAFNGELWPSRLIGFGIGTIVFSILSTIVFKEPLTTKTLICLFLSIVIVTIQLFWK